MSLTPVNKINMLIENMKDNKVLMKTNNDVYQVYHVKDFLEYFF